MVHFLIDRDLVEDFVKEHGRPERIKEHGGQLALFYESVPEDVPVEHAGGGQYDVTIRVKGKQEAVHVFAESYNG